MRPIPELEADSVGGVAAWRQRYDGVEILFLGRGGTGDRDATLSRVDVAPPPAAWLNQIHSARVVEGRIGCCGEGDALWTDAPGRALSVATADCVPVLMRCAQRVAAVHAGWRGIVAGIVPATLRALRRTGGTRPTAVAWIGPAIGSCCYEVGAKVADAVAGASSPAVRSQGDRERPHLDLQAAVVRQLERAGGVSIRGRVGACTRCSPGLLWSYRRDGERAGRNLAFVWLTPTN